MKLLLVISLLILVVATKILFDVRNEVTSRQENQKSNNCNRPNEKVDHLLESDFWLRLVALLSSFIALSLCQCSPKSINRTVFRTVLLLICLVPASILLFILYKDHHHVVDPICELLKVQKKVIDFELLEPQSFKLTCCIGLDRILKNELNEVNYLIYQNKTLAQLERETDQTVADAVQDVYLKFLNKRHEVHWTLSSRVLFLLYRKGLLHRCFELVVRPKEPVYQSRLSVTRLVLNLKPKGWLVSVEPANLRSNAENSDFEGDFLQKAYRTVERNEEEEASCSDYAALYPNCDSKQNCYEKCVNEQLLDESGHIASYFMIYKDQLTERQWSGIPIQGQKHPHSLPTEIRRFCNEKFSKDDCSWTVHERNQLADSQPFSQDEIVLPYKLRKEFGERKATSALPLDLLAIQGIFLALNLLRLVSVIGMLKFKIRKIELLHRLLHRLIYALCLLVLLAYIVHTFWAAMNEKLTYKQYFERPKTLQMPDAVMCFERLNVTEHATEHKNSSNENAEIANHNVNDDGDDDEDESTSFYKEPSVWQDEHELSMNFENGELTVGRLEELNADLAPETVFEKIIYLHKASNEWITLNSTSNFTNEDLSVSHFFLRANKCFSVSNRLDYHSVPFFYGQGPTIDVLRVLLKDSFKRQLDNDRRNIIFSFATKKRSQMEFNKMFYDLYLGPVESYVIHQKSIVKMTTKNHFAWLNPFAYFTEDRDQLDGYLSKLSSAFIERYNLTTLSLPLVGGPDASHLKISNASLFKQFYEEYVRENGPQVGPQREFALNELESHFRGALRRLAFDLKLSLSFTTQTIEQTNAAVYFQLVLHLANALIVLIVFALFDRYICALFKRFST